MRLTALQKNETSVSALAERLYPNLSDAARKKAEAALIKANPHLSASDAFRPGVVVNIPAAPDLKPKAGAVGKDPVADLVGDLQDAVASYRANVTQRLEASIADMTNQEEMLKQKEVSTAIKSTPEAADLAKSLVGSLRERKKIAAEELKTREAVFASITKDVGSLFG